MFFSSQTNLGAHTVHSLTLCLGTPLPQAPSQTSQLFGELALLIHLRLGLLGIFTSELVSPYFQHCMTFIHDLKYTYLVVWTMSKSL